MPLHCVQLITGFIFKTSSEMTYTADGKAFPCRGNSKQGFKGSLCNHFNEKIQEVTEFTFNRSNVVAYWQDDSIVIVEPKRPIEY